jgi:CheY-like chemotaxis protein
VFLNVPVSNQISTAAVVAGRILVVEDDPATAKSFSSILRRAGYEPTICYNGTCALRLARDLAPRAAFIDVHLPDLSGLVLTQKLREQLGADIPIIIVSGDTSMETLNSLAHVGATYFLSKPTTPAVMLQMLTRWIGGGPERSQDQAVG